MVWTPGAETSVSSQPVLEKEKKKKLGGKKEGRKKYQFHQKNDPDFFPQLHSRPAAGKRPFSRRPGKNW